MNAELDRVNTLPRDQAQAEFLRCCGSSRWAQAMTESRPFRDPDDLLSTGLAHWRRLGAEDWLEAFAHHPRIGDLASRQAREQERREQSGVQGASEETLRALAEGNLEYERKFGHVFLVCATGKGAEEMLALLRARLGNDAATELGVAAEEQAKITRIRLERLVKP
jgi:OHCU decarboxylase